MAYRFVLGTVAAALVGGWLLLRMPPAQVPAPAVAATARAAPAPGQGGWFSSLPAGSASLADPRLRKAEGSPAVYGRNGRAVDLGGLTVAQYIATRVGAARSGDVEAAYQVYQAESVCAAAEDPVADFGDPAQREQFLREREGIVKLCAGLSPAQVQERLGFLARAARAGHPAAQIDFFMEGPYGRAFDMEGNADDPTVRQWKQDALGYLKEAGGKCDHYNLALLSNVYDAGQLTARDPGMAMAYSIAAAVPRKKPVTEQQLRERFGDELSAAQFSEAMQLGAKLSAQVCPPP